MIIDKGGFICLCDDGKEYRKKVYIIGDKKCNRTMLINTRVE